MALMVDCASKATLASRQLWCRATGRGDVSVFNCEMGMGQGVRGIPKCEVVWLVSLQLCFFPWHTFHLVRTCTRWWLVAGGWWIQDNAIRTPLCSLKIWGDRSDIVSMITPYNLLRLVDSTKEISLESSLGDTTSAKHYQVCDVFMASIEVIALL